MTNANMNTLEQVVEAVAARLERAAEVSYIC